jgi:hypothetical protein
LHLLCLFDFSALVSSLNATKLTCSHSGANGAISTSAIVFGLGIGARAGEEWKKDKTGKDGVGLGKQAAKEGEEYAKQRGSKAANKRGFMLKNTSYRVLT